MDPSEVSFGGETSVEEVLPSQQEPEVESLASPFLSKVPVQDRDVVGRYIKEWDAGVTKKFQEYSGKLKPYEALGPAEEIQRYVNFVKNFQQDPENIFRLMYYGLQEQYGEEFEPELLRILQLEAIPMNEEPQVTPEEHDPNQVFQQNVVQELEELRAWREEQVQAQQSAEENAQLDNVLGMMHNKFGAFDDNWILTRLADHGNVEQAIKEWHQMIGTYSQGTQRQAPKVMGGQGGVPAEQVNTKDLRGKDRREIVANMLQAIGE